MFHRNQLHYKKQLTFYKFGVISCFNFHICHKFKNCFFFRITYNVYFVDFFKLTFKGGLYRIFHNILFEWC